MILCVQCAMEDLAADRVPRTFDQTIEAHMREYHPDQKAVQSRRRELERVLSAKQRSVPNGTDKI